MDKQEMVRELIAQMRATLANEQQLPQAYVDCRVVNLSTFLATQVGMASEPFGWADLREVRRDASY